MKIFSGVLLMILVAGNAHAYSEQKISFPDKVDGEISLHLWLPDALAAKANARRIPLVVISHGAGGTSEDHEDTARALADAGFIVAAVLHPGNNYRDNSYVRLGKNLTSRPRHVSRTIDHMLTTWRAHQQIDPARIGMFGFSAGGFTALVIGGGKPNLDLTAEHCRAQPNAWECIYLRNNGAPNKRAPMPADAADARVKAIVIAAPAVGYSFVPNGLAGVNIPVQLWNAQNDSVVDNSAAIVRDLLPRTPEYQVVANADHFAFLRPCDWKLRSIITVMHWFGTSDICADTQGFNRQNFHDEFNRSITQFFATNLSTTPLSNASL
ncbi:MAG: dienelactone hydrolase family protein [Spongiibacteraceae bacterium]